MRQAAIPKVERRQSGESGKTRGWGGGCVCMLRVCVRMNLNPGQNEKPGVVTGWPSDSLPRIARVCNM